MKRALWLVPILGTASGGLASTPIAGNLLITTTGTSSTQSRVREFTPSGTFVQEWLVPNVGGSALDLVYDHTNNLIHVYNKSNAGAFLSTLNVADGLWTTRTHPGFSTLSGDGGLALLGESVIATDIAVSLDTTNGLIRFDSATSSRFGEPRNYFDVAMGLDGFLYGHRDNTGPSGKYIDVYDPTSLAFMHTINVPDAITHALGQDMKGVAVQQDGTILLLGSQNKIYRLTQAGTVIDFMQMSPNISAPSDISLDTQGNVLVTFDSRYVVTLNSNLQETNVWQFGSGVSNHIFGEIVVPEPSTVAGFVFGGLTLLALRRRF